MRNKIIGLLIALSIAGIAGLGVALSSAQAADSNVYVVVNNRVCGQPGHTVRGILANVQPTGWTSTRWDNGDNIIYPKVRLHTKNTVSTEVACYKRYGLIWMKVGYRPVVGQFTPTKGNQTFWIG